MFEKEKEEVRQFCKVEDCSCCDFRNTGDVANKELVCAAALAFFRVEQKLAKEKLEHTKGQKAHLVRGNVILDVELLPDLDQQFGRCIRNGFLQVYDKTEWFVKLYKE